MWNTSNIFPLSSAMFLVVTCTPAAGQNTQSSAKKEKQANEDIFEWGEHPSLRCGKGTRIDFRARLAGELRDSEAPFDVYADRGGSLVSEIASLAELSDVHISEPSLENLFLHHTGRSLRD